MVGNDTAKAHHNSTSPNPMALKKESFLKVKKCPFSRSKKGFKKGVL